jgi:hypothetical protein
MIHQDQRPLYLQKKKHLLKLISDFTDQKIIRVLLRIGRKKLQILEQHLAKVKIKIDSLQLGIEQ